MSKPSLETTDSTVSIATELPAGWLAEEAAAGVAAPLRLEVRVEKIAGAELGLSFVERHGALEVTGCKAALLDAIAAGAAQVLEGDRLVEVNGLHGDPSSLREALASARSATSLVLTFERDPSVMEEQVLRALNAKDCPGARRALEDLKANGCYVQTALVTGMLQLANEVGERECAFATLDRLNLSARDLAEVLFVEALARDDLLAAAGQILGMRQNGHAVTVELSAQLCSAGLRVGRLNEVLPVLSFLGLHPDEFMVLMKLCQSHQQDPTARFLNLYEACAVHMDRAIHPREPPAVDQRFTGARSHADARAVDWLSRKVVAVMADFETAQCVVLVRTCFSSWALCLPAPKAPDDSLKKAEPSSVNMSKKISDRRSSSNSMSTTFGSENTSTKSDSSETTSDDDVEPKASTPTLLETSPSRPRLPSESLDVTVRVRRPSPSPAQSGRDKSDFGEEVKLPFPMSNRASIPARAPVPSTSQSGYKSVPMPGNRAYAPPPRARQCSPAPGVCGRLNYPTIQPLRKNSKIAAAPESQPMIQPTIQRTPSKQAPAPESVAERRRSAVLSAPLRANARVNLGTASPTRARRPEASPVRARIAQPSPMPQPAYLRARV